MPRCVFSVSVPSVCELSVLLQIYTSTHVYHIYNRIVTTVIVAMADTIQHNVDGIYLYGGFGIDNGIGLSIFKKNIDT